ncbi:hypothetical protein HKK55_27220 [Pseudomonas sp. ADAK18]|uniref:hypothetical protein n=1 Tax=Pseudomonas sp. ADAK18 TaxID=2730848 RepID=UPI0014639032|nr:hypothetical protein [Pseudomonas sp. ADAK18]QJI32233.1 hypothetical protein HKK55_27220 [Pseudomonas sp. ADAK18]
MDESRKSLKKIGARLYITVWQLLRGGAAILLLVIFVPLLIAGYYGFFNAENTSNTVEVRQDVDPRVVCGTLSNTIIEIPREYIVFWPEYEGKSSWEKGFTSNQKGCDAKLMSLYISVSWPDFQPLSINKSLVNNSKSLGLEITISPVLRKTDDMQYFLESRLKTGENFSATYQHKYYDKSFELFYIDSSSPIVPEVMNRYYWAESNGSIPVVFECYRTRKSTEMHSCTGYFIMRDFDYFVSLEFPFYKFREWREIVKSTKFFISSKVNK